MSETPRTYIKPALTESELLRQWRSKGLLLPDERRALRYLRHIGYYRLSAYVRSFEGAERDVLRPGTTFDDVLDLYIFDRKLRLHLLDAIERVEVALRASISDHLSRIDGPHWYENPKHFTNSGTHAKLLADVDEMLRLQRARRPESGLSGDRFVSALDHYVANYDQPLRPPTWIVFEELNFGTTRAVFDGLASREMQADIARSLGVVAPVLSSWLKSYQRVRNICAHHGRLWNRGLGVYPALPKSRSVAWLTDPTTITGEGSVSIQCLSRCRRFCTRSPHDPHGASGSASYSRRIPTCR
ncbi:Abi family protein [Tessaracoccus sp.]|uniref:Abi family protein n=1 Tax=Tessaracoccus sp. TaxID=1971211 RepID=UPI002623AFC8|nr:Abi family protein [Tessaracoccus sp.]